MNEKKIGVFSVISIVLGILAFIFAFMSIIGAPFFISIILGIGSIITGIIAFVLKNKVAMPIIGISLSAVGIIIALVIALVTPFLNEIKEEVDKNSNRAANKIENILSNVSNTSNTTNSNYSKNTINSQYTNSLNTTNTANTLNVTNTINTTTSSNSTNATNSNTSSDGQRVGNDTFGYITVPSNWTVFKDPDAPNTLQYSYANVYIATLYAIDKSQASAEDYAKSTMASMKSENAQRVTGATVNVGKYKAYQVYGFYSDENKWVVCWHFEAEDGKSHYISIEGPDASSPYFKIPDTFSLTK